jgi:hypothetical protein
MLLPDTSDTHQTSPTSEFTLALLARVLCDLIRKMKLVHGQSNHQNKAREPHSGIDPFLAVGLCVSHILKRKKTIKQ